MKKYITKTFFTCLAVLFFLISCGKNSAFELQSTAFKNGERIPDKYYHGHSGERQNISLPFNWINPPDNTKSFALVMHRPNPNWGIRWVVFNIPANCNEITENASGNNMPEGSIELFNSRRTTPAYFGIDPQPGGMQFNNIVVLYALNIDKIDVSGYRSYAEIQNILKGKILAKAEITGFATQEHLYSLWQ